MTGQIERIRVFIEVAERKGFAAAARHLGLSRSIATRYVADLETDLGVQLLVRTTRTVTPTLAGQIYLERARAISLDLDRANDLVREQQLSLSGMLRISAPLSFGQRFLPQAIAQFRILHADIDLKLDLTDRMVDIVSEDYDMALRISGPPTDKSTIWRKICQVPRVLVASPYYLSERGRPAVPADLSEHDCLGYSHFAGGRIWTFTQPRSGAEDAVAVRQPIECNDGDVIADLARQGAGIGLLPLFIVADHIEAGSLVPVLADWQTPDIWLTAYFPPYSTLPAKVRVFTEFIEALVAENPDVLEG